MIRIGINEGMNSSVVVHADNQILFAIQEERLNQKKEFAGFPSMALEFALLQAGVSKSDVGRVCLSNLSSPSSTREEFQAGYRNLELNFLDKLAAGQFHDIRSELISWVFDTFPIYRRYRESHVVRTRTNELISRKLENAGLGHALVLRTHHHLNHAASAYYGLRKNSHEPHLVLTLDGGGDAACSHVYVGENNRLRFLTSTPFGSSIGNIYSICTYLMGMTPHEHEYKLMGLSGYGRRGYIQELLRKFEKYLDLNPDNHLQFLRKTREATYHVLHRLREDIHIERFDNVAAALQFYTEDLLVRWVGEVMRETGIRKVLAAGGVFMNVKANKQIAALPGLEFFDVFPSCGDETLPFGAVWHDHAMEAGSGEDAPGLEHFYLGPNCMHDLQAALGKCENKYKVRKPDSLPREVARLLAGGAVVARCSGRMEFGARALGNRSILADPGKYEVVAKINKMIKQRDFWMPFAPAMLLEDAAVYLKIPSSLPKERISPYMMHSFDTTDARAGFAAGIHPYDESARAQLVPNIPECEGFRKIITEFKALTGRGVVLNTSFNLHGYPIVCGCKDALHVFENSDLRHLILDEYMIEK